MLQLCRHNNFSYYAKNYASIIICQGLHPTQPYVSTTHQIHPKATSSVLTIIMCECKNNE